MLEDDEILKAIKELQDQIMNTYMKELVNLDGKSSDVYIRVKKILAEVPKSARLNILQLLMSDVALEVMDDASE